MDFLPATVLIPRKDHEKWSTVACDQYTSDATYWNDVEKTVGNTPSALRIMLPEIYLEDNNVSDKIDLTYKYMLKYLSEDVFQSITDSYIYVERTLSNGEVRHGIVGVFDLEAYNFNADSGSIIRATEKTVLSRIPPRVKIRENAALEMPHIMILIDDRRKSVIEPLQTEKSSCEKIYDFDLMKNGGHITGYRIADNIATRISSAIESLYDTKDFAEKYGLKENEKPLLVFAVGDGNHSLATAKTCWENIKKNLNEEERKNHPARFALAELVNLHDESLKFEPIHRVIFNTDANRFIESMEKFFDGYGLKKCSAAEKNGFSVIIQGEETHYCLTVPHSNLTVGDVQAFIDTYINNIDQSAKVDYIHGEESVYNFASKKGNIGILLPAMQKNDLFKTIILDGVLPRKTFSMGHADDKRYYFEARKIIKD